MRMFCVCLVGLFLTGCAGNGTLTSIAGTACGGVFERPPYAVQGRTRYDQNIVDDYVEAGVTACGWQRPAARPPEIQNAPVLVPRIIVAPAKRKNVFKRIKDRVTTRPVSQTVPIPLPGPVTVEAPAPAVLPPLDPVRAADPLDELAAPLADKPVIRRVR